MSSLRAWAFLFLTLIASGLSYDVASAANTQVQFGRMPGNPGTVCIYDYSAARNCDPLFSVNDTSQVVTWLAGGGGGGTVFCSNLPAFAGDITTAGATCTTILATVNSNVGSFGGANSIPNFTVNAKGLITAAGVTTPSIPFTELTGSATCAQEPALTGDITTPAGSCATTLGTVPVTKGGTGLVTITGGAPLLGNGASNISVGSKSGNTNILGTTSGPLTSGHCVQFDSSGNLVDAGGACTVGGGGGTVSSGTANNLAYYASTGTAVTGLTNMNSAILVTNGSGVPALVATLPGANFPALTGDVTTSAGSVATTLGTVPVTKGGTGLTTLTANVPLIGAGTSNVAFGTVSGNTTKFGTVSGALVSGNCVKSDASGNLVDQGAACGVGGGGSGTVNTGTINQLAYYAAGGTTVSGETLLQAVNMPALTGDITTSSGTVATTLATSGVTAASYGGNNSIPSFSVDAKGRITSATGNTPSIPASEITGIIPCAQVPQGLGDVTSPAGSCTNTLSAINGTAISGSPTGTAGTNVVLSTSPSITSPTVLGSFTATGLVTNADLANSSTTVNGVTCTLGSPCTVGAGATTAEHGGRLTLQSGVPVMVTSQTAKTILYYAPYKSNSIALYNGSTLSNYSFISSSTDEVGLSLGTFGSGWATSSLYDVFVTLNGGVPVLCTGPTWGGFNNRAAAGSLAHFNGQYANSNAAAMPCRISNTTIINVPQWQATFVGTIITDSSGLLTFTYGGLGSGGVQGVLYVWNMYNRVPIATFVFDTGAQYTYTAFTWRAARGSVTNRVYFVVGQIEDACTTWYQSFDTVLGASGAFVLTGVAFNSTTVDTSAGGLWAPGTTQLRGVTSTYWSFTCNPIGLNYVQAIEEGDGTNANFFGTFGGNQLNFNYPM